MMQMVQRQEAPADAGRRPLAGAARHVLVVDDSRMQRRIFSAQLSRSGYQVSEAESAEEAIAICAQCEPDIVISDWMMAGMSGPEFCRVFRGLPRRSYGYFILLTSKAEKTDVTRGLESGADDFLSKPVNGAELRARLSAGARILTMQEELSEKNRLLREAQEVIDRDLQEARKLQQSLVRTRHARFEAADVSLLLRPAGHVGGDLVGFFPINERRVGLYGIDVSGHGITSALMMARIAGYFSGTTPSQNLAIYRNAKGELRGRRPAELAQRLNDLVLSEMSTESYFTLIYADVDLRTGKAELVQAGHPYPVLQRRNGTVEFFGEGGLPIGLIEGAEYETLTVQLTPGDRLVLVSDGITEASDRSGEMIDQTRLARMLRKFSQMPGPGLLDALYWATEEFAEGEIGDDVSAGVLEFHGPGSTERRSELASDSTDRPPGET
ncbi:fused response regulator/phosphatase [Thioclava sp. DLFJ5-1]|uniref:PP2C family protein-serine/threonine phosphatase n=1 Tax=Thioclava sp. DLFJ5-1 TaxID=1915314 RepID=UPI0009D193A9|nr:fused response regulator/phosphatase [Thioclava sp. DLFJ5-1]